MRTRQRIKSIRVARVERPTASAGFAFTPNEDVLLTQFGKREPNGTPRYVTLFNFATQAIIARNNKFRDRQRYVYADAAQPIWLTSGTQYIVTLYQGATDGYYFGTSSQMKQQAHLRRHALLQQLHGEHISNVHFEQLALRLSRLSVPHQTDVKPGPDARAQRSHDRWHRDRPEWFGSGAVTECRHYANSERIRQRQLHLCAIGQQCAELCSDGANAAERARKPAR